MGHVLPDDKSTWIALTNIYWIGRVRSNKILTKVGINPMKKVKDLTEEDQKKISDELKNYVLESDLKREVAAAIKRLKEIKCYRGMRHNLGLQQQLLFWDQIQERNFWVRLKSFFDLLQ